jgi:hypothetical protein
MSHVIVFTNDNGGVSVCVPTGELPIDVVLERDVPKERNARIVLADDLPNKDNDFFDAWEMNGATISVNLTKAKEIAKNRIRADRAPLLQAQDVAFQRALESGADTKAIVAEKQRLRDITKLADQATTLDELRAIKVEA